ncbi:gliding motility lipoprotein GldJ [Owenweeksia hongkongensis]|uniref:Gliding motility-associated lipoprotein GldJ n=1 Tax=Owenweeksia hongkongensis (strain DSM 17368 / CIP 108786 / JCM 12287 / NRRL B-23963 / UST20020801) TaxID=926562 RepID=G8R136_OWEHD|nr:gliding motility lipoprotein GldJ [Owenweeksia hongkongensis]AEV32751.1 gliding motility-associated lipoprotein GldJ [Owenweeksia hongkongensis DSM 17368]
MKKTIHTNLSLAALSLASIVTFSSCKEKSNSTGWNYNDKDNGGFSLVDFKGQVTGPGLVFVEGGTFTMGRVEEDFYKDWNNVPRQVSVSSFYMDENEVTNLDYMEYLYWLDRVFDRDYYPEIYTSALPDTLVWRDELSYNEAMVENYLRYPAYRFYPVVGVSWIQAMKFCSWRTDRVNEQILINEGVFNEFPDQQDADHFNTETYLYRPGDYTQQNKKGLPDNDPNSQYGKEGRPVKRTDGILLPKYRLPTEAEWEYAAYGNSGHRVYNRTTDGNKYTWDGSSMRNPDKKHRGDMLANFKRGRGDMAGVGGWLNDQAHYTMQVKFYPPNDYGLYDMAGNVSEWVLDVYRPLSPEDVTDLNPYRGNQFTVYDDNYQDIGALEVLQEPQYNSDSDIVRLPGELPIRAVTEEENLNRRNYQKSDYRDHLDGDKQSSIYYDQDVEEGEAMMYDYAQTTLIGNTTRVYKGGSWKDRAYWLSPGTRRYLEEDQSTDDIGFRCAMDRLGFQNPSEKREKEHTAPKRDKFKRHEYN